MVDREAGARDLAIVINASPIRFIAGSRYYRVWWTYAMAGTD